MVWQENGLLSFANPNYNLASPDVNSNPSPATRGLGGEGRGVDPGELSEHLLDDEPQDDPFEALYEELDAVCRFNRCSGTSGSSTQEGKAKTRRGYAALSISSMGVDVESGADLRPLLGTAPHFPGESTTAAKGICERNNNQESGNINASVLSGDSSASVAMGRKTNGFLDYYISLEAAANRNKKAESVKSELASSEKYIQESSRRNKSRSNTPEGQEKCDSSGAVDGGGEVIPHIHGQLTNELYAVPVKRRPRKESVPTNRQQAVADMQVDEKTDEDEDDEEEYLPPGWERHEDDDGPYYWHISSGTIQREPPAVCPSQKSQAKRLSRDLDVICNFTSFTSSSNSSSVSSGSSRSGSSGSDLDQRP